MAYWIEAYDYSGHQILGMGKCQKHFNTRKKPAESRWWAMAQGAALSGAPQYARVCYWRLSDSYGRTYARVANKYAPANLTQEQEIVLAWARKLPE